ncbi:hypothetical protein [Paenibacillus rigui]|uniref:hypothetical protein n=1 Tax=Paenibacillus rigui TaxID=554312 RepID=UPI0015C5AF98|nr:hypothetical protein [Paenibacillus rigui]
MAHVWAELLLWMIGLAGIVGGFCACLYRFISDDTTEFDLEFVWNRQYTRKDLELEQK